MQASFDPNKEINNLASDLSKIVDNKSKKNVKQEEEFVSKIKDIAGKGLVDLNRSTVSNCVKVLRKTKDYNKSKINENKRILETDVSKSGFSAFLGIKKSAEEGEQIKKESQIFKNISKVVDQALTILEMREDVSLKMSEHIGSVREAISSELGSVQQVKEKLEKELDLLKQARSSSASLPTETGLPLESTPSGETGTATQVNAENGTIAGAPPQPPSPPPIGGIPPPPPPPGSATAFKPPPAKRFEGEPEPLIGEWRKELKNTGMEAKVEKHIADLVASMIPIKEALSKLESLTSEAAEKQSQLAGFRSELKNYKESLALANNNESMVVRYLEEGKGANKKQTPVPYFSDDEFKRLNEQLKEIGGDPIPKALLKSSLRDSMEDLIEPLEKRILKNEKALEAAEAELEEMKAYKNNGIPINEFSKLLETKEKQLESYQFGLRMHRKASVKTVPAPAVDQSTTVKEVDTKPSLESLMAANPGLELFKNMGMNAEILMKKRAEEFHKQMKTGE